MTEQEKLEFLQDVIKTALTQLGMFPIAMFEKLVEKPAIDNSKDVWWSITDPTAYLASLDDGSREHAQAQHDIAQKLLEIRKLMEVMHEASLKYKKYHGE